MIDLETMVKSLRLSWLKKILSENNGTWKNYLCHQLKNVGGLFLFYCNYDINKTVYQVREMRRRKIECDTSRQVQEDRPSREALNLEEKKRQELKVKKVPKETLLLNCLAIVDTEYLVH